VLGQADSQDALSGALPPNELEHVQGVQAASRTILASMTLPLLTVH
jgi:hypothetical protein